MKAERMPVEQALEAGGRLPFCLLRTLSETRLGRTGQDPAPELRELLEARYFDTEEEIRILRSESGLAAVRLVSEPDDHAVTMLYRLKEKDGLILTLRRELGIDEDGQTYVVTTRAAGLEGGGNT